MGWNRQSRFYCEVTSARKRTETICSDERRGLSITAAGEQGAIELYLRAQGTEDTVTIGPRGGKKHTYRNIDTFEVWFRPWRSCEFPRAPAILIVSGPLDYDRVKHEEAMIRLDDKTMELYRTMQAIDVIKR